jgi:16S rRNA (uracil1498-N3)-methyltransferase
VSAPLFLAPQADLLDAAQVVLSGSEGRHAVSVRRLRVGERVDLSDGEGTLVVGRVAAVQAPDRLSVEVIERFLTPPPQPRIVVVQAIPKGERGERAVELLTEVGVDVIAPWAASRCVARWSGERGERARGKWVSTAREAGKQARRAHLPVVGEAATTADVVALIEAAAGAVVLHEEATQSLTSWTAPTSADLVVVVVPEGGIAADEVEAFVAAGAVAVHLGPSIMRTSTAGAAAASVLMASTGRWD